MKRVKAVAFLLPILVLLAGCGTPLNRAEDAYSVQESAARKSYLIVAKAFAKGKATEAQMAEARKLYDAYFQAHTRVYQELTAARAEGDSRLADPDRQQRITQQMIEVTRLAFQLAKLAKEVTP